MNIVPETYRVLDTLIEILERLGMNSIWKENDCETNYNYAPRQVRITEEEIVSRDSYYSYDYTLNDEEPVIRVHEIYTGDEVIPGEPL